MRYAAVLLLFGSFGRLHADPANVPAVTLFASDSSHPWNRVYACLLLRQNTDGPLYGADALDPPLWARTKHLLTGDSHRQALTCLDAFLKNHAERLIPDPLKRAVLQRDLWAVFDWAASGQDLPRERRELQIRLAQAIRRLGLTRSDLRALPDTYQLAVKDHLLALPPNLFQADGPWVDISAFSSEPTAIQHFDGRSRFLVFMRLPGGREATLAYVQKLRAWPEPPLVKDKAGNQLLNLALPQLPAGTEVALVRQAILIGARGELVLTPITESVQLRQFRKVTPGPRFMHFIDGPAAHDQDFFEFRLNRQKLFSRNNGGLLPVLPDATEYATFETHGMDPFEFRGDERQGVILNRCRACHEDSGIHSVQSRLTWMRGSSMSNDRAGDPSTWETKVTLARKREQNDFRLLLTLWR